ncbi:MAG TPA: tetratricopeptide repeat protein [Pseudolabrys sp.]|nr:tetratricopeptide repeat protein [Pseudolabrys sp.]
MPAKPALAIRLFASAALATTLALTLGGCKTTGDDIITGSVAAPQTPRTDADWRRSLEVWGARYRENPNDANAAVAYARALRATDQRPQAVAVLQQATIRNPNNMALLGEYGRALADVGDYNQALDVLTRAHTPDNPDWRILNAQGAVLDQLGRYTEAQQHYAAALRIVPGEPSIMSNLGLSYALTKDLPRAEATLREAMARRDAAPKVRQNLALVVGLQGRFAEAEQIARADLPPDEAAANVAYLKQMLAQRSQWAKKSGRPLMPAPDAGT